MLPRIAMAPQKAAVSQAPTQLFLVLLYFTSLFLYLRLTFGNRQTAKASPIIRYDREKLLRIKSSAENTFSPLPSNNKQTNNSDLPWLPNASPGQCGRQRKRGSRAGVLVRLRKRENQPPLPSILLANVQSLDNKLDELRSRMAFQRDIKNCNVMVFTETWLDPSAPDYAMFHTDSPFAAGTGQ